MMGHLNAKIHGSESLVETLRRMVQEVEKMVPEAASVCSKAQYPSLF